MHPVNGLTLYGKVKTFNVTFKSFTIQSLQPSKFLQIQYIHLCTNEFLQPWLWFAWLPWFGTANRFYIINCIMSPLFGFIYDSSN